MREDMSAVRRFLQAPTLLWATPCDAMLRALAWGGAATGAAVAAGLFPPALAPIGIAVAWCCMLSLDFACELTFPWDTLLLEAGALTSLLPLGSSWCDAAPQCWCCGAQVAA
jgi:hypothetical protein